KRPVQNAIAASPVDEGDGREAQKFDGRVEERIREDGVTPREHVFAIALAELRAGFRFAIEELHHGHAGNVFLEEGVDAGDGRAYAAIRVAHELTENHGDDEDARQDGQRVHGQAGVDFEEQAGHDREQEEVVDHGDHAGSEEIVQGVNVRGDA